jgi:hypothetical protein
MLPGHKSSISLHFYFRILFIKYLNPQHKKAEKTIKTPDPPLLLPPPLHHSACNCERTDGNAEEEAEEDERQKELGFLHIRSNHGACA